MPRSHRVLTDFIPLHQPKTGYRYGIDSLLLARFANLRSTDQVCDLGAGVGVLALWALTRRCVARAVAVEVQPALVELALQNAEVLGVRDRFEAFVQNWRSVKQFFKPHGFDAVLSNPPYRKAATGKAPPDLSKAIAKHEVAGAMPDLIKAAAYLIKPSGRFCVMYPPLRLEELIVELGKVRLKIERMGFVHPYSDRPATVVMVEAVRSMPRELKVEPPVIVYRDPEHYTPEVEAWVGPKRRI